MSASFFNVQFCSQFADPVGSLHELNRRLIRPFNKCVSCTILLLVICCCKLSEFFTLPLSIPFFVRVLTDPGHDTGENIPRVLLGVPGNHDWWVRTGVASDFMLVAILTSSHNAVLQVRRSSGIQPTVSIWSLRWFGHELR